MSENKEKKQKSLDDYWRLLRFYYLPVFVLAIFSIVLFFGLIPALGSMYDNSAQRNTVKKTVKRQDETIAELVQLKNDSNQTNEYLQSINTIAPVEVTNVTEFQESIKELATANGVSTKQAKTRELIFSEDETNVQQTQTSYLQLVEVPSDFVFAGSFENIKRFLGALYEQDEFIVIEEMNFSNPLGGNEWELDIVLNKYQFQVNENASSTSPNYLAVPEDAQPNPDVIEFINDKYLGEGDVE